MSRLDLTNLTSDDLLQVIPKNETKEWEFKCARIFDKGNFGQFKNQKLGKIVSSFANSGGGYLLLGKRDDVDALDPVPTQHGGTTMEDHLSLVIAQSVTPEYRDFEIHRVPIAGRAGESVLVVAFEDSQIAPHQSVADTNYYYRLPGHAVAAPHYYLDALRSRNNKAVIVLDEPPRYSLSFQLIPPEMWRDQLVFCVETNIKLRNASISRSAEHYALRVFGDVANTDWFVDHVAIHPGIQINGTDVPLLPTCTTEMQFALSVPLGQPNMLTMRSGLTKFNDLVFSVQPLSQDHAGEPQTFHPFKTMGDQAAMLAYQNAFDDHDAAKQRLKESGQQFAERIKQELPSIQRGLARAYRKFD